MHQRSIVRIGVPLAVAALALSACGSRGDSGGSSGGSTGGAASKTVKIGVIAPLSGDLSALGKGIQHSVELAVKQANDTNAIPGWKIEVSSVDDEAKADVGKNAATKLAADDQVVGVVGDLNSSVSQQTQPIFAAANITQVSPANTNPTLTIGADAAAPKRAYKTYFRTCTTDAVQGPFAAQYLLAQGIKNVATIHDKKAYGQGLVAAFTTEFTKGGGTVVAAETINPDESNYQAVVSKVAPSKPQAVYYGGEYPQGGPLSQQMKSAGLNVPLMGGDGIYDPKYIQLAGATSNGDLADLGRRPDREHRRRQEVPLRVPGGRLRRALCGLRWLLVRRRQRDHRRASSRPWPAPATPSRLAPRRSTRSARSRSTASPARSRSTSTATRRARS